MTTSDKISTLLTAAKKNATAGTLTAPQIEAEIIELVGVFEARAQHHFKRGPFFKKLRALLVAHDKPDLAETVHHYATAVNVLKHGTGASYRDLKSAENLPFTLKIPAGNIRLIDVTQDNFHLGLIATLEQAHTFLKTQQ